MSKRSKALVGLLGAGLFGVAPLMAALPGQAAKPPVPGPAIVGTSPAMLRWVDEAPGDLAAVNSGVIDATTAAPGATSATFGLDEVAGTHIFGTTTTGVPVKVPSFGYDDLDPNTPSPPKGPYLGPTVEAKRGTPISMTVTNKLANVRNPLAQYQDTTIMGACTLDNTWPRTSTHLHGGHTTAASDGGPTQAYRAAGAPISPPPNADGSACSTTPDYAGRSGSFTYQYPNDQEATQLWYHDHALGQTRFNPYGGLAGHYLVRDGQDTGRGLSGANDNKASPAGLPTGKYEAPLVIQDKQFSRTPGANGEFTYVQPPGVSAEHPMWAPESFGDVPTVNGVAWPKKTVDRGIYRIRLLNGSNARFYNLKLVDPQNQNRPAPVPMWEIGSEGGLFKGAPVPVGTPANPTVLIAPGERQDLLLDFRAVPAATAATYTWTNDALAPFPGGPRAARRGGLPMPEIMQFKVDPVTPATQPYVGPTTVPTVLTGTALPAAQRAKTVPATPCRVNTATPGGPLVGSELGKSCTRTVFLNEALDAAGAPVEVLLNNLNYAGNHMAGMTMPARTVGEGAEGPKAGTTEIWQIVNVSADAHPIHLHATQFQVLNRQAVNPTKYLAAVNPLLPLYTSTGAAGGTPVAGTGVGSSNGSTPPPDPTPFLTAKVTPPAPDEVGWKDTAQANPGEVLRIVVPWGGDPGVDPLGKPVGTGVAPFNDSSGAALTGEFAWHCHILEHEENDMMLPLWLQ